MRFKAWISVVARQRHPSRRQLPWRQYICTGRHFYQNVSPEHFWDDSNRREQPPLVSLRETAVAKSAGLVAAGPGAGLRLVKAAEHCIEKLVQRLPACG
jgi:hypothetical protein